MCSISSANAFAAVLGCGSVAMWDAADSGGDSSSVTDKLRNVQQIQSSDRAFAAILGDGSIVRWGDAALAAVTVVPCQIN